MAIKEESFCLRCNTRCLENDKFIEGVTVVWCKRCGERWLKGDRQRISDKLAKAEAKQILLRRSEQVKSWLDTAKNMNNPRFWSGDEGDG